MFTVNVELGDRSYPIFIGDGLLGREDIVAPYLGKGRIAIVSNDVVAPLYLEKVKQLFPGRELLEIILPDGEAHKTLDAINHIYDKLLEGKFDRNTLLVALGGGVVGDITGFAAATYLRGVDFIQIPTTLLAQVDSSVGGKTGVNHPLGKNMIGAFHQPRCVVADIEVLRTLPEREVTAGLAEVIKHALIYDAAFFDWLAENSAGIRQLDAGLITQAVQTCCEIKAEIVAKDEKESGVRALLNLGHTFGHAIETASGYGTWLHGETVSMGMVMAADLSCRIGWIDHSTANRIRTVIEENFSMPVLPPADISVEQYVDLMLSDKKAESGKIRFVLLKAIGETAIEGGVEKSLLEATLTAGAQLCR
jgi:3-dehydroquinate synthase